MKTAVIVLTYNRPETLLQVLGGLATQCTANDEVIIADDGSEESSVAAVKMGLPQFACPVYHVWHPDRGFTASRARNLAAARSGADYLVFLDGDCIPGPRFMMSHRALREGGVFVNGSRVLLSKSLTRKILSGEVDTYKASWADWLQWRLKGHVNKFTHLLYFPDAPFRLENSFRWRGIRSCNFGVWRDDFLRVNGFDESFQGWGHEDADLVLRLHNAGLTRKNGFLASEVYHLWHEENSRGNELINRKLVAQRLQTGVVRASSGVNDVLDADEIRVERLN